MLVKAKDRIVDQLFQKRVYCATIPFSNCEGR